MKRVLLVSIAFPPKGVIGAQRPARFCRYLPRFGWRPLVLTVAEGCALPRDDGLRALVPGELDVYRARCGSFYAHSAHFRRRASRLGRALHAPIHALASWSYRSMVPDEFSTWRGPALRAARRAFRSGGFDAVVGCVNPWTSGLAAADVASEFGVPYVIDARDPWTPQHGYAARRRSERVIRERELERRMLAGAAGFIANTIGQERMYLEAFPEELSGKTVVINNSFDPEEWRGVARHTFDRFVILHGGNVYRSRSLIPVMKALARIREAGAAPPGAIQLVNYGLVPESERAFARENGLDEWVRFEPPMPRHEFTPLLFGAGLLLVTDRLPGAVPGKTFDYLGSGNAILVVGRRDGDIAAVVTAAGQGFVVEEEETDRLVEIVLGCYGRWSRGEPVLPPADPGLRARFSAPETTGLLAGLLDRVTGGASGAEGTPAAREEPAGMGRSADVIRSDVA